MLWRPLPTAFAFALIGPAIGVALSIALLSPAVFDLDALTSGAFWELASAIYIIGAPPMMLTGLLVGYSASSGARLPSLTLRSAIYGALFGAVSALFWSFLGAVAADPGFEIVAAVAAATALAGFATALVVALFSIATGGRRRRVDG